MSEVGESWNAAVLAELRAIRAAIERIAIPTETEHGDRLVVPTVEPIWDCGHQHPTRREAVFCKRAQHAAAPPNADAGASE